MVASRPLHVHCPAEWERVGLPVSVYPKAGWGIPLACCSPRRRKRVLLRGRGNRPHRSQGTRPGQCLPEWEGVLLEQTSPVDMATTGDSTEQA